MEGYIIFGFMSAVILSMIAFVVWAFKKIKSETGER